MCHNVGDGLPQCDNRGEERRIGSTSTDLVVHCSSGVAGVILATSSPLCFLVPVTVDERGGRQKEDDNKGCLGCLVCRKTVGENGGGCCPWLAGNHQQTPLVGVVFVAPRRLETKKGV
ncbi:unnamed protein product [Lactuca saligna]|uniref:Uncharacterized protein n=1 Tax=Lactuca saligna TaxID=75948 RepID=A0AA35Z7G5_LACSI|nr:unnamed protein product [Lactuca saligna]